MPETLIKQIDRAIEKKPMYKESLSVYRELVSFVVEVKPEVSFEANDEALQGVKARAGFPLFLRESLPIDRKAASLLFPRLVKCLSETKRGDSKALERTAEQAQSEPEWLDNIIAAFLSRNDNVLNRLCGDTGLKPVVAKFLVQLALKPSLGILKEKSSTTIQKENWNYGYCPLCGSHPDIAYLDDEGKRILHCELCGTEWGYPRLVCPFCENKKAKQLGYFVSEEEEGYRVDFCKKCKRYLKTIDTRVIESPSALEVESLVTLHLDILAQQQGYKTPAD